MLLIFQKEEIWPEPAKMSSRENYPKSYFSKNGPVETKFKSVLKNKSNCSKFVAPKENKAQIHL
jgi:hypothetical protein